jgi:hypothetical protein
MGCGGPGNGKYKLACGDYSVGCIGRHSAFTSAQGVS